jgi:hypothetical protein
MISDPELLKSTDKITGFDLKDQIPKEPYPNLSSRCQELMGNINSCITETEDTLSSDCGIDCVGKCPDDPELACYNDCRVNYCNPLSDVFHSQAELQCRCGNLVDAACYDDMTGRQKHTNDYITLYTANEDGTITRDRPIRLLDACAAPSPVFIPPASPEPEPPPPVDCETLMSGIESCKVAARHPYNECVDICPDSNCINLWCNHTYRPASSLAEFNCYCRFYRESMADCFVDPIEVYTDATNSTLRNAPGQCDTVGFGLTIDDLPGPRLPISRTPILQPKQNTEDKITKMMSFYLVVGGNTNQALTIGPDDGPCGADPERPYNGHSDIFIAIRNTYDGNVQCNYYAGPNDGSVTFNLVDIQPVIETITEFGPEFTRITQAILIYESYSTAGENAGLSRFYIERIALNSGRVLSRTGRATTRPSDKPSVITSVAKSWHTVETEGPHEYGEEAETLRRKRDYLMIAGDAYAPLTRCGGETGGFFPPFNGSSDVFVIKYYLNSTAIGIESCKYYAGTPPADANVTYHAAGINSDMAQTAEATSGRVNLTIEAFDKSSGDYWNEVKVIETMSGVVAESPQMHRN